MPRGFRLGDIIADNTGDAEPHILFEVFHGRKKIACELRALDPFTATVVIPIFKDHQMRLLFNVEPTAADSHILHVGLFTTHPCLKKPLLKVASDIIVAEDNNGYYQELSNKPLARILRPNTTRGELGVLAAHHFSQYDMPALIQQVIAQKQVQP